MRLISNRALREFAMSYPDADTPLQSWRSLIEGNTFNSFAALRATFQSVDKVGDKYVFNISGNKYRLITSIAFVPQLIWVKAVLTHVEYNYGHWK